MISLTGFLITFVIGFVLYHLLSKDRGKNLPKGPFALPIVGNGLSLRKDVGRQLMEWYKQFGDIYRIYIGPERCFVVNDLKLAKELFNDMKFSSRPDNKLFQSLADGQPVGIINSSGNVWSDNRRFTLRHLRYFGFGKSGGEEMIQEEIKEFIDKLCRQMGKSFKLNKTFQIAVLNTLWQMMAGVRYEQDDPRLWSIFHKREEVLDEMSSNPVVTFAPELAMAAPKYTGWGKVIDLVKSMRAIIHEHVDQHRKSPPEDGQSRDFLDSFIKEIDATKDPKSTFYQDTGVLNMTSVIGDLFGAGFDTQANTISFTTLYLIKHPEVQKKFQAHLDQIVGRNRVPSLSDRPSLPYCDAVIAESMRMGTIVPVGLFHMATEDSKVGVFDVPQGSYVICPLYVFHNDEKLFPQPREFKPERHLSADGKKFHKHEAVVPFGFGKRACVGETLARDTVFLFVTNLFHRFTIRPAPENPIISDVPQDGMFPGPRDYLCVLTERL